MSRKLVSIIYDRRCGSMLRKAVLACMADRANDDGSGVWMSKGRIADEVEASRRAVITCIQALVEDGLLFDQGKRYRSTHQYAINVKGLLALPKSRTSSVKNFTDGSEQSVQNCTPPVNIVHTTCEPSSHEPLINQELSLGEKQQIRIAEAEALSAMRAQGLASQMGQQVLASLKDLNKRGKVSLREIDSFKEAVRGGSSDTLVLSASYEPPDLVATVLDQMKSQPANGDTL